MNLHAGRARVDVGVRSLSYRALLVFALLGTVTCLTGTASAHSGIQSYVYVSIFDHALEGRVEYPINDLGPAIGLEFPADADARLEVAVANADLIVAYTDEHLDLGDGATSWDIRFDPDFNLLETGAGDYLQVPFDVDETFDEAPRSFVATYSGIIESNPERDALFLVENDWGSATFDNEAEHLLGFSVGAETQVIDIEESSTFETLAELVRRGSVAVDRSLVVLTALVAVLVGAAIGTRRGGVPTSWRTALERTGLRLVLFLAPMTVVVGVLGLTSTALTERFAIGVGAVGVLLAGSAILLPAAPARVVVASSGAAAGVVLAESFVSQQLDRSRPILAFASFAVGALATVAFVTALLLPLVMLARRWSAAGLAASAVAAVAGLAGVVWLVERLADAKFPLRSVEFTVVDALTSVIVIGIVTAIAAALVLRGATSTHDGPIRSSVETDRDSERIDA